MQKSFLLVLGAFVVAALMFVINENEIQRDEVITSFEVSDGGIAITNSLTGENFVISNDEIVELDSDVLADIEPAAGEEEHGSAMSKHKNEEGHSSEHNDNKKREYNSTKQHSDNDSSGDHGGNDDTKHDTEDHSKDASHHDDSITMDENSEH